MFKRLWNWIKHPHGWPLLPFYVFTAISVAGAVFFINVDDGDYRFWGYIFYFLSALTFGYTVYTLTLFIPKLKKNTVALIKKNRFINRLYEQYGFRTVVFAVFSWAISLGNAVINGMIGLVNFSLWYGALGTYYLLLSLTRGDVLLHHQSKKKYAARETETQLKVREIKTYRSCGILLVLLPFALSFVILEMVVSDMAFVHSGIMIYVSAIYTFYKITMSAVNFFKARKSDEMTVRAIRNINLADALVSILALQTAMFHEFSEKQSIGYSNAITGAVVCAFTAAIGIFMIVYGSILIKKLKRKEKL